MEYIELKNIPLINKPLNKINLIFKPNQLNVLLGKNGIGKTSILRYIAGYTIPESGSININNNKFNFDKITIKELNKFLKIVKKNFIYIEDINIFYDTATIEENLIYFLRLNNINPMKISNRMLELIQYFEIRDSLDTKLNILSKGTKQKLLIILSLILNKKYILLDEPTTSLDSSSERKFFDLASNEQNTFIITSHTHLNLNSNHINKIYIEECD